MFIMVICTEESPNEKMKSRDLKPNYLGCRDTEEHAESSLSLHLALNVNVTHYFPDNE